MTPALLQPIAAQAIFRMETGKLPAYAGVELPGTGSAPDQAEQSRSGRQDGRSNPQRHGSATGTMLAKEEVQTYLAALRSRYKVEINQAALEAKER